MPKTLTELLDAPSASAIETAILQKLASAVANGGFPVTSWQEGGNERTLVESEADALKELWAVVRSIAQGGLVEFADGDWLPLLAEQVYDLEQRLESRTVGTIKLYCASGAGPYSITANQLWAQGEGGNRYNSTSTGTLATPGFSSVTHVGPGTGTVTPSAGSPVPTGYQSASANGRSYRILIIGNGGLGVGTYRLSTNGGTTYGDTTTIPGGGATTADPETGIIATFAGTFTAGDTYSWTSGGQLDVTFQSEFPNDSPNGRNYIDANSTITTLLTPLPGVTAKNFPPIFSSVSHAGTGTGTITPKPKTYAAVTASAWDIEITASGQVGAATFRYRIDGGAWSGSFTTAATYTSATLDGYNLVLRFTNGGTSPSFVLGETYSLTAPGSWITTQGVDGESTEALRARCRAKWSTLSPVPTDPLYEIWAREASDQVTRVRVATSSTVNAQVDITIGGQSGAVDAAVVTAVQTYVDARCPLTDFPVVASASSQAITLSAGTVRVEATNLTNAQEAAQRNVATYLAGVDIGGTVRLNQVIEAILRESGGEDDDVTGLQINGAAANLSLTSSQVATWTQTISTALTWTTY